MRLTLPRLNVILSIFGGLKMKIFIYTLLICFISNSALAVKKQKSVTVAPPQRLPSEAETSLEPIQSHLNGKLELTGGLLFNNSKASNSGTLVINGKTKVGVQGGLNYYYAFNQKFSLRSGAWLAYKNSEIEVGSSSFGFDRFFLEVPAHLYFTGLPLVSPFVGINLNLKLFSSCHPSSCVVSGEKSFILQPVIGADFSIDVYKIGFVYEFETEYNSLGTSSWQQSAIILTGSFPLR